MKLVGAKLTPRVKCVEELPGKAYFMGNDLKKGSQGRAIA